MREQTEKQSKTKQNGLYSVFFFNFILSYILSGEDAGSSGEEDAHVRDQHLLPQGVRRDKGPGDRLPEPQGGVHGHGEGAKRGRQEERGDRGLRHGLLSPQLQVPYLFTVQTTHDTGAWFSVPRLLAL